MRRVRKRYYVLGGFVILVAGVVALWDWDWFVPLAEAQASSALGRKVTISHLHVALARRPVVTVDGLTIANPDGFPDAAPLATVDHLQVQLDIPAYLSDRSVVIPSIVIDKPVIEARALPDGKNNWTFSALGGSGSRSSSPPPKLGTLSINDGHAHAVDPKMKADFAVDISTRSAPVQPATHAVTAEQDKKTADTTTDQATDQSPEGNQDQLVASAKGTYSGQPITGKFIGGALLSLRDATTPYPIDLSIENGPTHVSLVGTIADPLAFAGAKLKLRLSGPDLALLLPLTGIAIPQTPSYQISGNLDYADKKIQFHDIDGRIGASDLEGNIDVDPGKERPKMTATLSSRRVDLADLGGFIGSTPGRVSTPDQSAAQRAAVEKAEANPQLIPNRPISVPKLKAADIELHYRGARIEGRSIPLDNLVVNLSIENGDITLHPVSFGVGRGSISGNISLGAPASGSEHGAFRARADIDFQRIELLRLMASLHSFEGAGTIGGKFVLDSTGNSLAGFLDNGTGELKLIMGHGGNISALLVDLSGLEFGNAILSALGIPNKAVLQCAITDFALEHGIVHTKALLIDTSEANVKGTGDINLRNETLNMRLRTDSKHFTIGSLPTDILIDGTLKKPSIGPDAKELGARAGAAIGLGVLLTPLGALLPTIQFGDGDDNYCAPLIHQAAGTTQKPPIRR
jgi:uncharacterized protein involved in outer membrane biogenesis